MTDSHTRRTGQQSRANVSEYQRVEAGPQSHRAVGFEGEQSSLQSVFIYFFKVDFPPFRQIYAAIATPASILGPQSDRHGRCG